MQQVLKLFSVREEFFQQLRGAFDGVAAVFLVGAVFVFDVNALFYKFVHSGGAVAFACCAEKVHWNVYRARA